MLLGLRDPLLVMMTVYVVCWWEFVRETPC